jgi:hypothetical protein
VKPDRAPISDEVPAEPSDLRGQGSTRGGRGTDHAVVGIEPESKEREEDRGSEEKHDEPAAHGMQGQPIVRKVLLLPREQIGGQVEKNSGDQSVQVPIDEGHEASELPEHRADKGGQAEDSERLEENPPAIVARPIGGGPYGFRRHEGLIRRVL